LEKTALLHNSVIRSLKLRVDNSCSYEKIELCNKATSPNICVITWTWYCSFLPSL